MLKSISNHSFIENPRTRFHIVVITSIRKLDQNNDNMMKCCFDISTRSQILVTLLCLLIFVSKNTAQKCSIIGCGFYGSQTAFRLAQYDIFKTITITDIIEGKSEGIALDINQCSALEGFKTHIEGYTTTKDGDGFDKTANSDIIIITAGVPRRPEMSRLDLLHINSKIISDVVTNIIKYSPNAIIIIVSNPIDEMVALTKILSKFPHNKVIGQAGVLDSARFAYFISKKLNVPVSSCKGLCLGSHGDLMIPCVSQSKVNDKLLTDLLNDKEIEEICNRTRNGGGEIVALLKTGSAYFCPAVSASRIARAIILDTKEILPCHAWVKGEYGLSDLYIGVEAKIGRNGILFHCISYTNTVIYHYHLGIEKIVESELTITELQQLKTAADILKKNQLSLI